LDVAFKELLEEQRHLRASAKALEKLYDIVQTDQGSGGTEISHVETALSDNYERLRKEALDELISREGANFSRNTDYKEFRKKIWVCKLMNLVHELIMYLITSVCRKLDILMSLCHHLKNLVRTQRMVNQSVQPLHVNKLPDKMFTPLMMMTT
jgi:hypothetical protein